MGPMIIGIDVNSVERKTKMTIGKLGSRVLGPALVSSRGRAGPAVARPGAPRAGVHPQASLLACRAP